MARWEKKRETCPTHGGPRSECANEDQVWYVSRKVCWATATREAAWAKYRKQREKTPWHDGTFRNWVKERSDTHPFHFDHGVTIEVSPTNDNPDDRFLS